MKGKKNLLVGFVFMVLLLWALASSIFLFKQNKKHRAQLENQQMKFEQELDVQEAIRKSSLVSLMGNILDKVDDELKENPNKSLSESTIDRIAALSYSFEPYEYSEGDSLSTKKYSPERGQLLLALANIDMDSTSFKMIKSKTSFSGAGLEGANLRGLDLSSADMKGANLRDADLRKTNLSKVNLLNANLWGANMSNANLIEANLRRANMEWVNFNCANLRRANFSGANLTSAKMAGLDFSGVDLKYADLTGAFLEEANLAGVNMDGSVFRRANLSGANMTGARLQVADFKFAVLTKANFSEANLISVDLTKADLREVNFSDVDLYKATFEEENWIEKLQEWKVVGAEKIGVKYEIKKDLSNVSNYWTLPIKKK